MNSILIVDDDDQLRASFAKLLSEEGYEIATAGDGREGVDSVAAKVPDLVIMDVRMPGMSGLEAFKLIKEMEPKLPVIIMTAFGTTDTAIEATKMGAFDYILKPFDIPDILNFIKQAIEAGRLMRQKVALDVDSETAGPDSIIGRSEVMQRVYKAIGRAAPTDATVLIRGESGTGKELVARAVYQHSLRAEKPFMVINCVAIPETLLESELFGYEKGAFTGAASRRVGKIEQANGGTVFLDEIGDMPFSIQAKILRLLEEKKIERLGGREQIPVDVRIIAATNMDLEKSMRQGRFREDLYYRLKVVTIELPPLRNRKEDIPLLSDYFMSLYSKDMGINNPGIDGASRVMVENHNWPGNVRELANALRKALIFSRGCPIRPEDMSQALSGREVTDDAGETGGESVEAWVRKALVEDSGDDVFAVLTDRFASMVISEALNFTDGNRTKAAKLLGLSRPTLHAKIEKFGIKISTSAKTEEDG